MAPIGDGFVKSIEHKHFLKTLIIFAIIVGLAWGGYHLWIKERSAIENQERAHISQPQQMQFHLNQ